MRSILLLVGVLLSGSTAAHADALSRFLDGLESYSANFEQVVTDADGREAERSTGSLLIQRPGRFRWRYEMPYPQLIVADGVDLYLYDPDLEQVSIKAMDEGLQRTPALLLTGDQPVSDNFIVGSEEQRDGLSWLHLRPKQEEGDFDIIWVGFRDGELAAMQIIDGFGQTSRLYFHDGVRDPLVASDAFVFVPPPGTDVIRAPRAE